MAIGPKMPVIAVCIVAPGMVGGFVVSGASVYVAHLFHNAQFFRGVTGIEPEETYVDVLFGMLMNGNKDYAEVDGQACEAGA